MKDKNRNTFILAGDIGGTKSSLALYASDQILGSAVHEATYQNTAFNTAEEMLVNFLEETNARPDYACFGVAGPVADNKVQLTNYKWFLDGEQIRQLLHARKIFLINDLVATAMGAINLPDTAFQTLNTGIPDPHGAVAVIAPGTGLGEAFLVHCGDSLLPCPSEGGHGSFAPVNDTQARLLRYMLVNNDHVSTEMVCSGIGIPHIYDFLKSELEESPRFTSLLSEHPDKTKCIIDAALDALDNFGPDTILPQAAIQLFVDILASEASNLALKVLATGGVYIGGGITPRILPFLTPEIFMASFCQGGYQNMLSNIPVKIILEPNAPLTGAAVYCMVHT